MPIAAGIRIGPYEVVDWIGAGGMGDVYRARDPRLERDVAIKLIADRFAADASRVHRFEQEARAAGRINHPNILSVYDVGTYADAPYIVSELLEGESLGARLKSGALSARKAMDYARQTAAGLAAAHAKNLIHRDLKPDNLFITTDGRVKILDFGIAKLTVPGDEARPPGSFPTETLTGMVVGTQGYMSPEQVRGEPLDARSDIFSFGAVFYEAIAGRPAFIKTTQAETMAAILREDPPEPVSSAPRSFTRILLRCLEKTRDARFQSARDLGFALEHLSESSAAAAWEGLALRRGRLRFALATILLLALAALATRAAPLWRRGAALAVDPFANASFTLLTNWEGAEEGAEISPDGKLVVFLSDRAGEWDIWLSQIGTGLFTNLTADFPPLTAMGSIVKKVGFSADSSEIWFNPADGKPLLIRPWAPGGTPRPFLVAGANTPAWSPDETRLAYVYKADGDDPIYVADHTGADARPVSAPDRAFKNMNPVWSTDSRWIYFTRGVEPQDEPEMNLWRVSAAGGSMEQVSRQHLPMNFLTAVDNRTLLFIARAEDRSGPWLWAFDLERMTSRRIPSGVDSYTSISSSRDGRRLVATVANPSAALWRVPLTEHTAHEQDAQPYPLPVPTGLALAPRFRKGAMFYLSARGTRDGLWRVEDGQAMDVWRAADGALSEPPAVSPDGTRLAVVVRRRGRRQLMMMAADGTNARTFAPTIDVDGAAGQGAADWSPDGTRIVVGGRDAAGPGLFIVPVDSGVPTRVRDGQCVNPIWSPNADLIVYTGRSLIGQVPLHAVRSDGTPIELPPLMVRPGGYRFTPDGNVVFLPRIQGLDFWLLDMRTKKSRQIVELDNRGTLRTFDVTPDGKSIVFDRSRQNSNVVLIELSK